LQNKAKKLKAKRKKLEKSNSHLEGQAYQLRKDQKEAREENIKLMIGQKSQSDSMLELEKVGFSLHTL
jgi:DNA helicase IV